MTLAGIYICHGKAGHESWRVSIHATKMKAALCSAIYAWNFMILTVLVLNIKLPKPLIFSSCHSTEV